jgi:hypothetical protein
VALAAAAAAAAAEGRVCVWNCCCCRRCSCGAACVFAMCDSICCRLPTVLKALGPTADRTANTPASPAAAAAAAAVPEPGPCSGSMAKSVKNLKAAGIKVSSSAADMPVSASSLARICRPSAVCMFVFARYLLVAVACRKAARSMSPGSLPERPCCTAASSGTGGCRAAGPC